MSVTHRKETSMEGINEVEQLLKDCKYVMAVASVWDACDGEKSGKVKNVYLQGFSNRKQHDRQFDSWNNGFESFFYDVHVKDGKVFGRGCRNVLELDVKSVINWSFKSIRREAKRISEVSE